MKKRVLCLALLLAALAVLALFTGCKNKNQDKTVDYENPFDWEYTPEFTGSYDADMQIDGVLDEAVWRTPERKWMTFSEGDVTVWHTVRFTEKGLYIASRAKDTNFVWNARFNYSFQAYDKALNSAFAYVIAGGDTDNLQMFSMFDFAVDTHNRCSYEQTRFAAKAVTDQPIDGGEATEMTAELFVAWDDLNIGVDPESGMPENVRIIPYYRHIGSVTDPTQNKWITHLFAERNRLHCYAVFDGDGYAFTESQDAVWGNSATGISRSAGWDLSRSAEGVVTTNAAHSQAIFLRDAGTYSDRYLFSVTMRADGGFYGVDGSDGLFRGGLCNASDTSDLLAVYLNGTPLRSGRAVFARLQPNPWTFADNVGSRTLNGYDYDASDATVHLSVIKDGAYFYYIVEDELVYIAYEPTLAGKTFPGVYTLSSRATFSDPSFTNYAGREEELHTLLEKWVYRVETPSSVRGGTLEAATVGVDRTAETPTVSLLINPNPGYVLTGLTVNGESTIAGVDSVEWIRAHIRENRIDLPLSASVTIDATFTRFDRAGDLITLRGDVTAPDGVTRLGGATLVAYDVADPLFSYTVTTNAQGRFEVTFLRPVEGGYDLGGRNYLPGDRWRVIISTAAGYPTIYGDFSLSDADESGQITRSFRADGKINMQYLEGSDATSDRTWNDDGSFTLVSRANATFVGLIDASGDVQDGAFLAETDIALFLKSAGTWGLNPWNTYGIGVRFSSGKYLILGASLRAGGILKAASLPGGAWKCELEPNGDTAAVERMRAAYGTEDTLNIKVVYCSGNWSVPLNDVLYGTYTAQELGITGYGAPVSVGFGCRLDDSLPQSATFSGYGYAASGDEAFRTVAEQVGLYKTITFPEGITATADGEPLTSGDKCLVGTEISLSAEASDAFSFVVNGASLATGYDGGVCRATFVLTEDATAALVETRRYTFSATFAPAGHPADTARVTVWLNGRETTPTDGTFSAPVGSKVVFSHPAYMDVTVTVGQEEHVTVAFARLKVGNARYDEEEQSLTLPSAWQLGYLTSPGAGEDFAVRLTIDPADIVAWLTYGIGLKTENGYFSYGFSRRDNAYQNNTWLWGFVSPSKGDWSGSGLFAKCGRDLSALTKQLAEKALDSLTLTFVYHSDTHILDAYINDILVVNYATGLTEDVTGIFLISTDGATKYLDWGFGIAGDDAYSTILAGVGAPV